MGMGLDVEEFEELGAYREAKFADRYVVLVLEAGGQERLWTGEIPDHEPEEVPDERA